MKTTKLLHKTIELIKSVGTLPLSDQIHHSHQYQLHLYMRMKERTDSTIWQASLVMEVLKMEYVGTLSVLNLGFLAMYCWRLNKDSTLSIRYGYTQNLLTALLISTCSLLFSLYLLCHSTTSFSMIFNVPQNLDLKSKLKEAMISHVYFLPYFKDGAEHTHIRLGSTVLQSPIDNLIRFFHLTSCDRLKTVHRELNFFILTLIFFGE